MIDGYYYLHTNGDLIFKPGTDCAVDIRDSNFARCMWPIDLHDRMTAWGVIVEGFALGANLPRVIELANKWGCTDADADVYAGRIGVVFAWTGEHWLATPRKLSTRETLKGFPVGHGGSKVEAMANLAKEMGLQAGKMWRATFPDLLEAAAKESAQ